MSESCQSCTERKKQRSEAEKRDIVSRLNRIGGQIAGIRKMVEEDMYCHDVLIPDMTAARETADQLEALTDAKAWPFPVYSELLFSV